MLLREAALARHAGSNGNLEKFGQFHQVIRRLGVHHALSRIYHRVVSGQERGGGLVNRGNVRARNRRLHRAVAFHDAFGDVRVADVRRNFDHHGAGPPHLQQRKRATHRVRDQARGLESLDALGHRFVAAD